MTSLQPPESAPAEEQAEERAPLEPIAFTSRLERRELFRIGVQLVLWNRISLTLMLSGPVLWLVGVATSGESTRAFGAALSWLLVVVPLAALLTGNWSAYRPGTRELLAPVAWSFDERGIRIGTGANAVFADWSEFRSSRRAGRYYLLYVQRGRYIIVPADAVPPERSDDFEGLVAAKVRRHRGT